MTIKFTDTETGAIIAEMKYNAHPPFAVLVAVPFSTLEYRYAHLVWNLVTFGCFLAAVAVVVRVLEIPFPWPAVFPAIILLLGNPVLIQIYQGQLNFALGTLVIAAWATDRADRPKLAGIAIGLAGARQTVPAFLACLFCVHTPLGGAGRRYCELCCSQCHCRRGFRRGGLPRLFWRSRARHRRSVPD